MVRVLSVVQLLIKLDGSNWEDDKQNIQISENLYVLRLCPLDLHPRSENNQMGSANDVISIHIILYQSINEMKVQN